MIPKDVRCIINSMERTYGLFGEAGISYGDGLTEQETNVLMNLVCLLRPFGLTVNYLD